jgi:hypothetical protein
MMVCHILGLVAQRGRIATGSALAMTEAGRLL